MAESSGGVNMLAFLVGILIVAVVVLAILYFTGVFGGGKDININLKKGSDRVARNAGSARRLTLSRPRDGSTPAGGYSPRPSSLSLSAFSLMKPSASRWS